MDLSYHIWVGVDKIGTKNDPAAISLFTEGVTNPEADWTNPAAMATLKGYSVMNRDWRVKFRPAAIVNHVLYDHWGEHGYEGQSFGKDWRPAPSVGTFRFEFNAIVINP